MTCKTGDSTTAKDGLLARCVGPWSQDKVYYISHYAEIFSTGMKNRFPSRAYVDFFSGPGRCVLSDTGEEFAGTPMCALNSKDPFSEYHLVEQVPDLLGALKARAATSSRNGSVQWYGMDANVAVDTISQTLPRDGLVLAVIDPTGLQFHFDSLAKLTKHPRVDFIYLFPDGMDIRRNLERYLKEDPSIDEALGTIRWRDAIKQELLKYPPSESARCPGATKIVFQVFKEQLLEKLKYPHVMMGDDIRFKNRKDSQLYYLVFASRNAKGHEFWRKIQAIGPTGQRKMTYE
jgi:three-Cys-motif partner protein